MPKLLYCKNNCGLLSFSRTKDVEFEDEKGNDIILDIAVRWCPICLKVHTIEND